MYKNLKLNFADKSINEKKREKRHFTFFHHKLPELGSQEFGALTTNNLKKSGSTIIYHKYTVETLCWQQKTLTKVNKYVYYMTSAPLKCNHLTPYRVTLRIVTLKSKTN